MSLLMWVSGLVSIAQAAPYGWDGERVPSLLGPAPIPEVWLWQPEGEEAVGCADAPEGCLDMSLEWSTRSGGSWWRVQLEDGVDPWSYRDTYRATGAWVLVEPTLLPPALDWQDGLTQSSWAAPYVMSESIPPGVRAGVVGYASDPDLVERSDVPLPTPFGEGLEDALIDLMRVHAGFEGSAMASISHHPVHTAEHGFNTAHALQGACGRVGPGGVVVLLTQTWSEGRYQSAVVNPRVEDAVHTCVEGGVLVVAPEGNDRTGLVDGDRPADPDYDGALVVGALADDPALWGATRARTVLWADPTVQLGEQLWGGTAASAARVAGIAWRIQSEFVFDQGEPLTPADLQRFLRVSSYESGTPDQVPHLQGGIDRLEGPRSDRRVSLTGGLGLIVGLMCVSMGATVCVGFFLWLFRGLFSREKE